MEWHSIYSGRWWDGLGYLKQFPGRSPEGKPCAPCGWPPFCLLLLLHSLVVGSRRGAGRTRDKRETREQKGQGCIAAVLCQDHPVHPSTGLSGLAPVSPRRERVIIGARQK